MSSQTPTPSSEIIHLVSAFTDALDSLPPSLTRSLSDLKELDAVLNGSLQSITDKLKRLHSMMHTPEPGTKPEGSTTPTYTPLDRLKLLREVAEDARVFRLGGEDKIRVATNTCETLSTHTSHLGTLSTLLMGFLPAHLLPHLPAPSAPHGYPASNTTATLRARYDYAAQRHPGQGSTTRLSGALGMVRDHYDLTRGRTFSGAAGAGAAGAGAAGGGGGGAKKRAAQIDYSIYGDDYYGASGSGARKDAKDPSQRHPNQYTKKRLQAAQQAQALAAQQQGALGYGAAGGASPVAGLGGYGGAVSAAATNAAAGVYSYAPSGAADGKSRREGGSRAGSVAAGGAGQYYGAAADDYAYQVQQQRGAAKRKQEEMAGGNKRRKKGIDNSPDPAARMLPSSLATGARAPRRQNSASTGRGADDDLSYGVGTGAVATGAEAAPAYLGGGAEDELEPHEGEDEADKTLYCFCQRVSFGEMIGCDNDECEHEWFHLPCVGLKSIPEGRWFCDECRRTLKAGKKGRR
ncbi:hypothetical protein JCM10207_008843 [Rhodosporidiobolus poonsookiae]